MTSTKKLFGAQRLILDEIGYTDSFVIPAGHIVTKVIAETKAAMDVGGKVSIGTANSGIETASFTVNAIQAAVAEEATLTVTAGAVAGGTITVAGAEVITIPADNAPADVAAKIVTAVNLGTTWTAVQGVDADADKVYLTAVSAGAIANPTFVDSDPVSGVAITVNVTQQGIDAAAAGDITVAGETVTLLEADLASVEDVAAKIAAHSFTSWTVVAADDEVTFTALGEGAIENVAVALDTATGITFSAVTTTGSVDHAEIGQAATLSNLAGGCKEIPAVTDGCYALPGADKTAHVNINYGELVNNFRLYVTMEKYI
jgi:hypothetical protein